MDITIKPHEPQLMALSVTMTDKELFDTLIKAHVAQTLTNNPWEITVNDYDEDPRDLYEIPEVRDFFCRLLNLGFMAILEETTFAEGLRRKEAWCLGFGALEIWMIAHNYVQKGEAGILQEHLDRFYSDMAKSKVWLEGIMSREDRSSVRDGQHRLNLDLTRPYRAGRI